MKMHVLSFVNSAKAMLRGKLIALNTYIGKAERSILSDLNFHLQKLENKEQIKPKENKRKKIGEI